MPDFTELRGFPGPLVPGQTHKGEVIQFCQSKIQNAKLKGSKDEIGKSFYTYIKRISLKLKKNSCLVTAF